MADKVKVTAAKAKTVFLPGYGQLVLNPESKDKRKSAPEVPVEHIDRVVAEGAIKAPRGYKSPAERKAEADEARLAALSEAADDGSGDEPPSDAPTS